MCGEQRRFVRMEISVKGSPPRVRGTGGEEIREKEYYRITPACAGNRSSHSCESRQMEDHPRVCGEQGVAPGFCV